MSYTTEERQKVIDLYNSNEPIESIASLIGKSTRSVLGLLSKAGLYKREVYKPKYADKSYTKIELVELLEAAHREVIGTYEGLDKAPKQVLIKLLQHSDISL